MKKIILLLFLFVFIFSACSGDCGCCAVDSPFVFPAETQYRKITAEEAEKLIAANDAIILDVRTSEEFGEGHIDGAILLPYTEIGRAAGMFDDKEQVIIVYCRAGRRSEIAARELIRMGFTRVYDVGAMEDWVNYTADGTVYADFNFDGHMDYAVWVGWGSTNWLELYHYYLWCAETASYVRNRQLEEINATGIITVDAENRLLVVRAYHGWQGETTRHYECIDGEYVLVRLITENYEDIDENTRIRRLRVEELEDGIMVMIKDEIIN
jgi:rhodanese-related sulfurtransferase